MAQARNKLFYAETAKGYTIKVLFDVLAGCLPRAVLFLRDSGISTRCANTSDVILFDVNLARQKFANYKFRYKQEQVISFNLKHFVGLIKNVKKKDSLALYINQEDPDRLFIRVQSAAGSVGQHPRVELHSIVIQYIPEPEIWILPDVQYYFPMVIGAKDFQKIKKMTSNKSKILKVEIQRTNYMSFSTDSTNVMSSKIEFGEIDEEDEEDEEKDSEFAGGIYRAEFFSSMFSHLMKLPGLCNQISFSAPKFKVRPLKISMDAGTQTPLGEISIFIKDKHQIDMEEAYQNEIQQKEQEANDHVPKKPARAKKRAGRKKSEPVGEE